MPLIELECEDCGLVFKKLVKTKDKRSSQICQCGGDAGRILSSFGVNLKGKGFKHTDHASIDRRVGADAEAKWEIYKNNWQAKRRLERDNPGKAIVKGSSGSYEVQAG